MIFVVGGKGGFIVYPCRIGVGLGWVLARSLPLIETR